jgi:isocitrate/isopropylmalate dehydrogenase
MTPPRAIAVVPGDGIGPEVTAQALAVLRALRAPIEVDTNRGHDAILAGTRAGEDRAVTVQVARLLDERLCPLKDKRAVDVDLVIVYGAGEPALRAAFEWARRPGRRRRVCGAQRALGPVAPGFRDVSASELPAVEAVLQLLRTPERCDVIVSDGVFGPVLASIGAALAGGIALGALARLDSEPGALFCPAHGAMAELAGTGRANPLGTILALALLLDHLGFAREAARVDAAVRRAVGEDATTPDLGGGLTTQEVGAAVLRYL